MSRYLFIALLGGLGGYMLGLSGGLTIADQVGGIHGSRAAYSDY